MADLRVPSSSTTVRRSGATTESPSERPAPTPAPGPAPTSPDTFVAGRGATPVRGAPVSTTTTTTPPSPAARADLARLTADANARLDTLPPDVGDVRTGGVQLGQPDALVTSWQQKAGELLGPGDRGALDAHFGENGDQLRQMATALVGPGASTYDGSDGPSAAAAALYAPAISTLRAQNPDATFRLVATPVADRGAPSPEGNALIEMNRPGAEPRYFELNTFPVANLASGAQATAAMEKSGLVSTWHDALRATPGLEKFAGATPEQTLQTAKGMGVTGGITFGLHAMPPDAQARFVDELARTNGLPYCGLLQEVPPPRQALVAASADHLATASYAGGVPPSTVDATVSVAGVPGAQKAFRFMEANHDAIAAPIFSDALLQGDAPRALSGVALQNQIGMTMGLAPTHTPSSPAEERALADGRFPLYDGKALELIAPVEAQIRATGGTPANVTAMPVLLNAPSTGPVRFPLYRVQSNEGGDAFVDHMGRRYASIADWREHNTLPAGTVSYAADGHLSAVDASSPGVARVVTEATHAVVDTNEERAGQLIDLGATVGGFVFFGASIAGTGGAALPAVAAGLSVYGAARTGGALLDRATHGQSVGIDDPAARQAWLGFGASAFGLVSVGAGGLIRATGASDTLKTIADASGAAGGTLGGTGTALSFLDVLNGVGRNRPRGTTVVKRGLR